MASVIDTSGSMADIATDMSGGYNQLIQDQRGTEGDDCRVSLTEFNSFVYNRYDFTPVNQVPKYAMSPCGGTALYDAIGETIDRVGRQLAALPEWERPSKVIITIVTDGQENMSKTYTKERVFEMIQHQREVYKWQFMFLGANQDSFIAGQALGISPAMTMNFGKSAAGATAMYSTASKNLRAARSAATAEECAVSLSFSDADRAAQLDVKIN